MPVNDPNILDDKIRFYNRLYRGALMLLAIISTTGVVVGAREVFIVGRKIDTNVQNTQQIIQSNQRSALEARKLNLQRQEDLKGYIKCILLAHFDHPELASPDATKQQVSDALDRCAKVE